MSQWSQSVGCCFPVTIEIWRFVRPNFQSPSMDDRSFLRGAHHTSRQTICKNDNWASSQNRPIRGQNSYLAAVKA